MTEGVEPKILVPWEALPITRENFFYWYKGVVNRVVDGDTYIVDVDFGARIIRQRYEVRGFGYDTYERFRRPLGMSDADWMIHQGRGLAAFLFVQSMMPGGSPVVLLSHRDEGDKYGRLLASVYIPVPAGEEKVYIDLAATLRENKFLKEGA